MQREQKQIFAQKYENMHGMNESTCPNNSLSTMSKLTSIQLSKNNTLKILQYRFLFGQDSHCLGLTA